MRARYLRARSAFRLRRADVGCLAPQELLSQAGRVARQDVRHVRAAEARLLPDYKQHDRGTLCGGVPDHIKPPFVGVPRVPGARPGST